TGRLASAIEPESSTQTEVRRNPACCQNRSFARRSFDHLVGAGEKGLRHRQAERLRGLNVDDQLELGRLLDRQIGRLGAFEDLAGVSAQLAPYADETSAIANQAAGLDKFTKSIDRRDGVA